MPTWQVSVVVSTYNRSRYLRLCIASLEAQTVRPYEVVIAADGSDIEHVCAIEQIVRDSSLTVRHVRQEDRGFRLAANRNNGVRAATGNYLFFTDGDLVLFPDVLEQHLAVSGERRWVGGAAVRFTPEESLLVTEDIIRSGGLEAVWPGTDDERWRQLRKAAAVFRRRALLARFWPSEPVFRKLRMLGFQASVPHAAFEAVNGFDEVFEGWGEEDLDLGLRLQLAGCRGYTVLDQSRVLHLNHDRWQGRSPNRSYYERPRHGEFRCCNGLAQDLPPDEGQARHVPQQPPAHFESSPGSHDFSARTRAATG